MWRCQEESQSKVWNGVQSAVLLETAPVRLGRREIADAPMRLISRRLAIGASGGAPLTRGRAGTGARA